MSNAATSCSVIHGEVASRALLPGVAVTVSRAITTIPIEASCCLHAAVAVVVSIELHMGLPSAVAMIAAWGALSS